MFDQTTLAYILFFLGGALVALLFASSLLAWIQAAPPLRFHSSIHRWHCLRCGDSSQYPSPHCCSVSPNMHEPCPDCGSTAAICEDGCPSDMQRRFEAQVQASIGGEALCHLCGCILHEDESRYCHSCRYHGSADFAIHA